MYTFLSEYLFFKLYKKSLQTIQTKQIYSSDSFYFKIFYKNTLREKST